MIFKSIKWRIQIWHGLLLLFVLGGFGYSVFELQRTRELRRVDEELQTRLNRLMPMLRRPARAMPESLERRRFQGEGPMRQTERPFRFPPGMEGPTPLLEPRIPDIDQARGFYYVIWRGQSRVTRSANAPANVPKPERGSNSAARTRGEWREMSQTSSRDEDAVLVGRSISAELAELRRLALLLFAAGGGVLVLGLAGGWFVASRAIRPIENISATAVEIASGDLAKRIAHDETESELGRLASILNSTFSRLESAFAQQTRFTADVSHELRTPITVILSQIQMTLAREREAAEYRETLVACERAAQRMRTLVESLMQLARLDAGQEQVRREKFDVADCARESVELVKTLAEEKDVKIRPELEPASCMGDSDKIGQVITNLLNNAIGHTERGGSIEIRTRVRDGMAELAVSDTGAGIPAEELPLIFERFYQVEKSRTRGGSGLGLAIARAIVNAHSGTLTAQSEVGKGSTFILRLPAG